MINFALLIIQEVKEAIGPLIEETLEKKLEEKLGMVRPDGEAVVQPTRRSYASTLQGSKTEQVNNFRDIVAAAKNEEKAEERERISRQNNKIIFGREETENDQDAPDKDKVFYNQLITDLTIGSANAKSIIRIGNKRDGGKRPIKVTLTSTTNKEKIMNNLRNLKDKGYNGISVTEDHTMTERNMIKDFTDKSKSANLKEGPESDKVWVVRGSPKNYLFLKKVTKRKAITQPQTTMEETE